MLNSTWLSRLPCTSKLNYRHIRLATYDDVFDLLCESYVWRFGVQLENLIAF